MALNSWKKNLNRVGQRFNEKVAGYKGTQKGDEYKFMTDQVDLYKKHFDELASKTVEVLQPNPATRAKMGAIGTLSKIRGGNSNAVYKQSEAELAEVMHKYGNSLGSQSNYGRALLDAGSAFVDVADLKFANEDNIKENFLGPLNTILSQDIKEINNLRKKCESKRLDYDTIRKSHEKANKPEDQNLEDAYKRYEEAMENASAAMTNFLNSEPEHILNLSNMVKSMIDFHSESARTLNGLYDQLQKRHETSQREPARYSNYPSSQEGFSPSPPRYGFSGPKIMSQASSSEPCCRSLFAFKAENDNELEFEEGEIIKLIEQVDNNWFLGEIRGRTGHFPINYVEVLQPLNPF